MVAIVVGLSTAGALVIAAGFGFEIGHSPARRVPALFGIASIVVLVLAVAAGILGSAAYTRLSTVAVVSVPDRSETAAPQSAVPQPAEDAWLHFVSDSHDFIGAGQMKVWTIVESNFTMRGTGTDLRATVSGRGDQWDLEFRAPSNGALRTGMFDNAERAPFVTGKAPGLDVTGDGRGCNTLSGRFSIRTLTWTKQATVAEMDVVFEQHCEMGPAALRGELWFTTEVGLHRPPPSSEAAVNI